MFFLENLCYPVQKRRTVTAHHSAVLTIQNWPHTHTNFLPHNARYYNIPEYSHFLLNHPVHTKLRTVTAYHSAGLILVAGRTSSARCYNAYFLYFVLYLINVLNMTMRK